MYVHICPYVFMYDYVECVYVNLLKCTIRHILDIHRIAVKRSGRFTDGACIDEGGV